MLPIPESFEFDYAGTNIIYGRGCVNRLAGELSSRGLDNVLVVCGAKVGSNDDVMTPLLDELGDRCGAVFDGSTPAKLITTVYDGIEVMNSIDADVVVGVGGGSSINIARQMTVFAADDRSLADFREEARIGELEPPNPQYSPLPVVIIPTTFAGADLSAYGSVTVLTAKESPTGQPIRSMGPNKPVITIHDPDLFDTTPMSALAGSAMNGFNKSIETIYARNATPITDGIAMHALRLFHEGYPRLSEQDADSMERSVIGSILAQIELRVSIIHAFGHAFARRYPIQQGVAHAIMVPHILRYLFERVDGRRKVIAEGLGIRTATTDEELADEIIETVTEIRDSFPLPTSLQQLDEVTEDEFPILAEFIVNDSPMKRIPSDLSPTTDDIESVLHDAW